MTDNIVEQVELLWSKNNSKVYPIWKELQRKSEEANCVYTCMDKFINMIESDNSYVRTRGLTLIVMNAKWDIDYKLDEIIDRYLKHITDKKPITARQCIKLLPIISKYKPDLKETIVTALQKADISFYPDSMQQLVYKDIQEALEKIRQEI